MVGGMKERAPVGSSGSLLVEAVLFLVLGRPIVVTISVLYELMLKIDLKKKEIYCLIGPVGHADVNASCRIGFSACPRAVGAFRFIFGSTSIELLIVGT